MLSPLAFNEVDLPHLDPDQWGMGQARNRLQAYEGAKAHLFETLDPGNLRVARAATALFEGFIRPRRFTGGCYVTTMVLHQFLRDELGVGSEVVIGYVNDGTDDIFISHAWLEHDGLKTDITLHVAEDPEASGGLIVADQALIAGRVTYTYHGQRTEAGLLQEQRMLAVPGLAAIVRHKAQEHLEMAARARNPLLMSAYLSAAPDDQSYEVMASVMRANL